MGEPSRPAVRAHFLKLGLSALGDAAPEALDGVGGGDLGATLEAVEQAGSLSWLPVEHLLTLDRAGLELLGEDGLRRLVLDTMRRALSSPLWEGLLKALIGWFGLSPPQVARWAPRAHALAFRHVGRMTVPSVTQTHARVVFEGVPPQCLAAPPYLASLGYALEFFFELTNTHGGVRRVELDEAAGSVGFEVWCEAAEVSA